MMVLKPLCRLPLTCAGPNERRGRAPLGTGSYDAGGAMSTATLAWHMRLRRKLRRHCLQCQLRSTRKCPLTGAHAALQQCQHPRPDSARCRWHWDHAPSARTRRQQR